MEEGIGSRISGPPLPQRQYQTSYPGLRCPESMAYPSSTPSRSGTFSILNILGYIVLPPFSPHGSRLCSA